MLLSEILEEADLKRAQSKIFPEYSILAETDAGFIYGKQSSPGTAPDVHGYLKRGEIDALQRM